MLNIGIHLKKNRNIRNVFTYRMYWFLSIGEIKRREAHSTNLCVSNPKALNDINFSHFYYQRIKMIIK